MCLLLLLGEAVVVNMSKTYLESHYRDPSSKWIAASCHNDNVVSAMVLAAVRNISRK